MKIIGEGAEAVIYLEMIYGKKVIVKYRAPKRYRIKELDSRIRHARTRREAKAMENALQAGVNAPSVIGLGENEIYMEMIEGTLLKDTAISNENAKKAGEQLGKLHNGGITHGDFTPANIIDDGKKVYIIDFGLAESTMSSEERALDILLMKRQIDGRLYSHFIEGYSKTANSSAETLKRLKEVEERGRYQVRTLA